MANTQKVMQEIAARREAVHSILRKAVETKEFDSMKAKDVPQEILDHVSWCLEMGLRPNEIRKELGIRSQTSKEWQKISAAMKMGMRVDGTAFFLRLFGRNERMSDKMYKILDEVLDQDIEKLKETDKKGVPLMDTYFKYATSMVDAMNRLQQSTVKIGADLGVFAEAGGEKGSGGTTIIIKNNVQLPTPKEILEAKKVKQDVVECKTSLPSE